MKENKKILKTKERGITLIVLVITIIVLLILASISIGAITGDNGIINQAKDAKNDTEYSSWEEQIDVAIIDAESKHRNPSMEDVIDELINKDVIDNESQVDKETGRITTNEPTYTIEGKLDDYIRLLEADTGKEALILVYNVSAGDIIELPYSSSWYDSFGSGYPATFNFTVDWGDESTDNITNSDIETKAVHKYTTSGEKRIIITGIFESIWTGGGGIEELVRVEQWGITGLKSISLEWCENLTQIATPTENSFINLEYITFENSSITSIPKNLFANCPDVTSFSDTFAGTEITSIPENLFANCPDVTSFSGTFSGTEITSIPENLFENCKKVNYFTSCFSECEKLEGNAPELWLRVLNGAENGYIGTPNGRYCFYNSTKLENYEDIPYYWKEKPGPM